ncbi:MAG: helix-turn-helix transcriptional regulator [Candidatus Aenigmatarchaeota archaeon]
MKKIAFVTLVAFLMVSGIASAESASFYRRISEIDTDTVSIEDTIIFSEAPGNLEIPLFFQAEDFSSRSTFEEHECSLQDKNYGSLITCELREGEEGRLTLEFETESLIRDVSKHFHFEDDLNVPLQTKSLVYRAELKEGLMLIDEDMNTPFSQFSPGHGEEGSDGRRIYVVWSEKNVSEGDGLSPSVSFEAAEEISGVSLEAYIVVFTIALIGGFAFLATRSEKGTMPEALKEDERGIIELVKDAGGEIKQKRIVDNVKFSKAKVSRLVQDLKERDLLETEKVGRTNRVKLKGD